MTNWEKEFCEELLKDGEITWENHFDNNDQYEVKYDEKNTFNITKRNGEWIYITRVF